MRKSGFTLAEVLITLTIIGVIAAITIPNLMQSWRKYQIEVGLKSAYSILNNAVNVAKANSGLSITEMLETAYNTSSNHSIRTNFFVDNYLLPNLKTQKTCKTCSKTI